MKIANSLFSVFACVAIFGAHAACAAEEQAPAPMHHHEMPIEDNRISLGISPQMKLHQLASMREHLEAVQAIVGLILEKKFDEASKIAHQKLGLTPEKKAMCMAMHNQKFTELGFAFHESGDKLGEVLQTGDAGESFKALHKTMQFCVQCHATYRQ